MRQQSNGRRPRATPKTRYGSLDGFYMGDPRRVRSRERDVGLWWREEIGGPLHRAAWVADTGELYLVRLGPQDAGGGEVEVLATVSDRERLESALRGWRERCGEQRSLGWLRARAARLDGRRASGERRVADGQRAGSRTRAERVGSRARAERGGSSVGSMLTTMSSVASELAHKSKPRARATSTSTSPWLSAGGLAPEIAPAK